MPLKIYVNNKWFEFESIDEFKLKHHLIIENGQAEFDDTVIFVFVDNILVYSTLMSNRYISIGMLPKEL